MKIYTKTGDKGNTSLYTGTRVSKSSKLIHLVGILDELNSNIGWVLSYPYEYKQKDNLIKLQNILFDIGAEVAGDHKKLGDFSKYVIELENNIDIMELELKKLTNFILPGGSEISSRVHILRSKFRDIERDFIRYKSSYHNQSVSELLNRASDFCFVLARYLNKLQNIRDINWKKSM